MTKKVIFVAGMHRSGTSAMARCLSLLGAKVPTHILPPADNNSRGFWEPKEMVEINDSIFKAVEMLWHSTGEMPAGWQRSPEVQALKRRAEDFIDALDCGTTVLKDPRLSRLLPFWETILLERGISFAIVVVLRHPTEVAFSLKERDGFTEQKCKMLWLRYSTEALRNSRNCPTSALVSFDAFLGRPDTEFSRIASILEDFIEFDWDTAGPGVAEFLSQDEKHHNVAAASEDWESTVCLQLYDGLQASRQELQRAACEKVCAWLESLNVVCPDNVNAMAWELGQLRTRMHTLRLREQELVLPEKESLIPGNALKGEQGGPDARASEDALARVLQKIKATDDRIAELERGIEHTSLRQMCSLTVLCKLAESGPATVSAIATESARMPDRAGDRPKSGFGAARKASSAVRYMAVSVRHTAAMLGKLPGLRRFFPDMATPLAAGLVDTVELEEISSSEWFDSTWYLAQNKDVEASGIDPAIHFSVHGWREGRDPSSRFGLRAYLEANPDVSDAGVNPLLHWIRHGQIEGRLRSPPDSLVASREALESAPEELVLGDGFEVSRNAPRRFPARPPSRPSHWQLSEDTLAELDARISNWPSRPSFAIVVPTYNTKRDWLEALIASLHAQFYMSWRLYLVDDLSDSETTRQALAEFESHDRICVIWRERQSGISAATNDGIERAREDYVVFMDHDDLLEPDALLQVARAIAFTGADVVYTDEDKIDEHGQRRYDAHHKAAWSPDLLLSQNYISHLTVVRKQLVESAGGLRSEFDGSQDHDLLLRVSELSEDIVHVPMTLYHWRAVAGSTASEYGAKSRPWEAGRRAVEDAVSRRGIAGRVVKGRHPGTYAVIRRISGNPLVSILIPFRDQPSLLSQCVESILDRTSYPNFEIIGLDNQSEERRTRELMERLLRRDSRVRFEAYDAPFNFSAINNFGASIAQGEHLLLLNNDTEVISNYWLEAMLAHSQREDTGAVGAKLLYPDGHIQHAGVIIGIGGVAGHSHKHMPDDRNGYFSRPHLTQNISAVTGACLMVKKALYEKHGGLDESALKVAFNDVDFCLRLRNSGCLNVYEPAATLFHHESISRGYEDSVEKQLRFSEEARFMRSKYRDYLRDTDPYYSPGLPLDSELFGLA